MGNDKTNITNLNLFGIIIKCFSWKKFKFQIIQIFYLEIIFLKYILTMRYNKLYVMYTVEIKKKEAKLIKLYADM